MLRLTLLSALTATACATNPPPGGDDDDDVPAADAAPGSADASPDDPADAGGSTPLAPELGTGDHTPGSVDLVVVLDSGDLDEPMDVEVDPVSGGLWVVNQGNDGWTVLRDPGAAVPDIEHYQDDSYHFFRRPAALAFAGNGERALATCQESTNGGDLFMGPVAWTSNLAIFYGGTASHYDMLHESPNCMGIAWQKDHVWWVFNGYDGVIDKVNYHGWHPDAPNGLGGEDHTDGEYFRYAQATVERVAGVHSGMEVGGGWLYVADTGNARIVRLDAAEKSGTVMESRFDEVPIRRVNGQFEVVVAAGVLDQPSGLALRNGLVYAADGATGRLHAFDTDGTQVNWLDTGLGAGHVGALAFDADGRVLFIDPVGERVYRVVPH